jgi:hypothetical protein
MEESSTSALALGLECYWQHFCSMRATGAIQIFYFRGFLNPPYSRAKMALHWEPYLIYKHQNYYWLDI